MSSSVARARLVWIAYTRFYRDGGPRFARVARTLARERVATAPRGVEVRVQPVDRKADFVRAMEDVARAGETLVELHFVGHGGMYGPMFGTTAWPEQLSPHEWRTLTLPLADDAAVYVHACRSARWFAPFLARVTGRPCHGYHGYTTFSRRADRVAPAYFDGRGDAPLYVFGSVGKKSHGWLGAAAKHARLTKPEPLRRFEPGSAAPGGSYDPVAALYDAAFGDVHVRTDEWPWLDRRIPRGARVLDVGCGNGALLDALAPRAARVAGVDASSAMLAHAEERLRRHGHAAVAPVRGPTLPYPDGSFDVVVSLLSFRYLDWDPMLREILRVLVPDGRLLVVDMVASPASLRELPRTISDRARHARHERRFQGFAAARRRLVEDARWAAMLADNPIRAEHELRWYLGSRFPAGRFTLLNRSLSARMLAFESGPAQTARLATSTFP